MIRSSYSAVRRWFVRWLVLSACVGAWVGLSTSGSAIAIGGTDLHAYWDQRCLGCHGHAADFSRRFLRLQEGRLKGWHHVDDLAVFLRNHYAADEYADALYAMLLAQREAQPIYREKCAGCHQTAADLVRNSISAQDGILITRRGGRDLAEFLKSHGGLSAEQLPAVLDTLKRVRGETGGS